MYTLRNDWTSIITNSTNPKKSRELSGLQYVVPAIWDSLGTWVGSPENSLRRLLCWIFFVLWLTDLWDFAFVWSWLRKVILKCLKVGGLLPSWLCWYNTSSCRVPFMIAVGMRERWSYFAKHRSLGSRGSHIGAFPHASSGRLEEEPSSLQTLKTSRDPFERQPAHWVLPLSLGYPTKSGCLFL